MKKYILSIDQGTTSSRVVLYNLTFQILDIVQKEFKQYFPKDGWVEHDAMEIWHDVINLIKKILKKNKIQLFYGIKKLENQLIKLSYGKIDELQIFVIN